MICYINGISCISALNTAENQFLPTVDIQVVDGMAFANLPSFKEIIPPAASRRMAKAVKMGIYTSNFALKEANLELPDAIILGTGLGCMEDSEKFLKAILDNNEQFLTPTSFIQSTHNTVAGQIALGLQCKGYNFTYVNGRVSFESALLDAQLQLASDEANSILVGGVDESAPRTLELYALNGSLNRNATPEMVFHPHINGILFGEGAGCFVLENTKKASTYAGLVAVEMVNTISVDEVQGFIEKFLAQQNLTVNDIDVMVNGNNGSLADESYFEAAAKLFENTPIVVYKHLSGDFDTASTFGFWSACHMIAEQTIPTEMQWNQLTKEKYSYCLIYNQHAGIEHSLILLKDVKA